MLSRQVDGFFSAWVNVFIFFLEPSRRCYALVKSGLLFYVVGSYRRQGGPMELGDRQPSRRRNVASTPAKTSEVLPLRTCGTADGCALLPAFGSTTASNSAPGSWCKSARALPAADRAAAFTNSIPFRKVREDSTPPLGVGKNTDPHGLMLPAMHTQQPRLGQTTHLAGIRSTQSSYLPLRSRMRRMGTFLWVPAAAALLHIFCLCSMWEASCTKVNLEEATSSILADPVGIYKRDEDSSPSQEPQSEQATASDETESPELCSPTSLKPAHNYGASVATFKRLLSRAYGSRKKSRKGSYDFEQGKRVQAAPDVAVVSITKTSDSGKTKDDLQGAAAPDVGVAGILKNPGTSNKNKRKQVRFVVGGDILYPGADYRFKERQVRRKSTLNIRPRVPSTLPNIIPATKKDDEHGKKGVISDETELPPKNGTEEFTSLQTKSAPQVAKGEKGEGHESHVDGVQGVNDDVVKGTE